MLKVYEYEKCSTCRKALQYLDKRGVRYERVPIVDRPPSEAELKRVLKSLGGNIRKLFNTSGQLYRELKIGEKVEGMTESQAVKLLASHGKLIKRPFVVTGDGGWVGFNETEWKRNL